ncbi:centrosomal and chromosomal factor-like isoform X3 [Sycon ciliatum]|uniref:centrosomal and chromosomal factor-like isoform X3 n=1 Tax=Sycon ciliatum TaxID=27933 RepID=UPI0031F66BED
MSDNSDTRPSTGSGGPPARLQVSPESREQPREQPQLAHQQHHQQQQQQWPPWTSMDPSQALVGTYMSGSNSAAALTLYAYDTGGSGSMSTPQTHGSTAFSMAMMQQQQQQPQQQQQQEQQEKSHQPPLPTATTGSRQVYQYGNTPTASSLSGPSGTAVYADTSSPYYRPGNTPVQHGHTSYSGSSVKALPGHQSSRPPAGSGGPPARLQVSPESREQAREQPQLAHQQHHQQQQQQWPPWTSMDPSQALVGTYMSGSNSAAALTLYAYDTGGSGSMLTPTHGSTAFSMAMMQQQQQQPQQQQQQEQQEKSHQPPLPTATTGSSQVYQYGNTPTASSLSGPSGTAVYAYKSSPYYRPGNTPMQHGHTSYSGSSVKALPGHQSSWTHGSTAFSMAMTQQQQQQRQQQQQPQRPPLPPAKTGSSLHQSQYGNTPTASSLSGPSGTAVDADTGSPYYSPGNRPLQHGHTSYSGSSVKALSGHQSSMFGDGMPSGMGATGTSYSGNTEQSYPGGTGMAQMGAANLSATADAGLPSQASGTLTSFEENERYRLKWNRERERKRVQKINQAYKELRKSLADHLTGKKAETEKTKLETLREAIQVIQALRDELRSENKDPMAEFLEQCKEEKAKNQGISSASGGVDQGISSASSGVDQGNSSASGGTNHFEDDRDNESSGGAKGA